MTDTPDTDTFTKAEKELDDEYNRLTGQQEELGRQLGQIAHRKAQIEGAYQMLKALSVEMNASQEKEPTPLHAAHS